MQNKDFMELPINGTSSTAFGLHFAKWQRFFARRLLHLSSGSARAVGAWVLLVPRGASGAHHMAAQTSCTKILPKY